MTILPFSAQFEVEKGCTHRCAHCYNGYFEKYRESRPTDSRISKAVSKSGLFHITLTGGEPLLASESLYEAMDFLNRENVDFDLNTNLHLLTYEDLRIMKDKGIKSILTSILGDERTHNQLTSNQNAFTNLMRSLEIISKEKIHYSVNMVVTEQNKDQVYSTGEMLFKIFVIKDFCATPKIPSPDHLDKSILSRKDYIRTLKSLLDINSTYGINVHSLHPAIPCMFNDDERENYERFFESRGCVAGKGTITISTEGDIRVCSHENQIYGNLLEDSLPNIFSKMDLWNNGSLIPKECAPCTYASKCRGGCRITSKVIKSSFTKPHPYFKKVVSKKPQVSENKNNLRHFEVKKGDIRFRENFKGVYSIFIDKNTNITTDEIGLKIFRRFMSGASYDKLHSEIKNEKLLDDRVASLFSRGLLVSKTTY